MLTIYVHGCSPVCWQSGLSKRLTEDCLAAGRGVWFFPINIISDIKAWANISRPGHIFVYLPQADIMAKKKYYVVWQGVNPGIYMSWRECERQIKGVKGAMYKLFDSQEEAGRAYSSSPYIYIGKDIAESGRPLADWRGEVVPGALAVDAACSGNPGPMEYRGVYLPTGQEVFHLRSLNGTNNIGEFLAIVHALALILQYGAGAAVYSDSRTAISWIKQKKCKTRLGRTPQTEELFSLVDRAEVWLQTHEWETPVLKWNTGRWGEIPADFGRK